MTRLLASTVAQAQAVIHTVSEGPLNYLSDRGILLPKISGDFPLHLVLNPDSLISMGIRPFQILFLNLFATHKTPVAFFLPL